MEQIKNDIHEIKCALVGSFGNPGLVQRLESLENRVDVISRKIYLAMGGAASVVAVAEILQLVKR